MDDFLPDWAHFFTEDEYSNFIITVSQYFSKLGIRFKIEDGITQQREIRNSVTSK